MPPYPIARIPKTVPEEKWLLCLRCSSQLVDHETQSYWMSCPGCGCDCIFRKEDLYYCTDGLVIPCMEYWDTDCDSMRLALMEY